MPRLKNVQTGAVVSVSDETAKRLGAEWQAAEPTKQPRKTSAAKADAESQD